MYETDVCKVLVLPLSEVKTPKEVLESIEFSEDGQRLYSRIVDQWLEKKANEIGQDPSMEGEKLLVDCLIEKGGRDKVTVLKTTISLSLEKDFKRLNDVLEKKLKGTKLSSSDIIKIFGSSNTKTTIKGKKIEIKLN